MICVFLIYSFNKHLSITYYIPGNLLRSGDENANTTYFLPWPAPSLEVFTDEEFSG